MKKTTLLLGALVIIFAMLLSLWGCADANDKNNQNDDQNNQSSGQNDQSDDQNDQSGNQNDQSDDQNDQSGNQNDQGGNQNEGTVPISIIFPQSGNAEVEDDFFKFFYALERIAGTTPEIISESDAEREREIVFGRSERAVSVKAYRLLDRIELSDDDLAEGNPRILIYSDGKSVAVAYEECEDDIALVKALATLQDKISSLYPDTQAGVLHKEIVNLDEYYQAIDDELVNTQWIELENKIGGSLGQDVVSAMKNLYALYSDGVISWFANLYEPAIGGYYYSNSARNTDGYLPDAESTSQALRFINSSGMLDGFAKNYTEALPQEISEQIINFIYNLQDPNGYFYHPQWTKAAVDNKTSRRSRDLDHCVSILSAYGVTPKYKTPTGVGSDAEFVSSVNLTERLGASVDAAVSKIVAVATAGVAVDPNLKDEASFRKYLESLDVRNNSYSAGNTLTAFFREIQYRDEVLQEQNAGYSLVDIMIEYLNSMQYEHNGLWHAQTNYYAVNGLMKISGVYSKAGVPLPNAEKATRAAMDAIVSDEEAGAVTDIYNTWYAVNRMFNIMSKYGSDSEAALVDEMRAELLSNAPEAIAITAHKLSAFRKDDGSFSYTPTYSSTNSQGMPVAVPDSYEGDVNATLICTSDILIYIYGALGLEDYKVSMCTYNDWRHYKLILEGLGPVIKDGAEPIYEPITFDDEMETDEPNVEYLSVSARSNANGGGASIVADERDGNDGNVFKVVSVAGTSDSIDIESPNRSHAFSCFGFEGDFCLVSSDTDFPVRISVGDCYIISLKISGGRVRLLQSTSGTASKSQETILCDGPELGEWFSIKVEYYKGDHDSVRIKIYFDGNLNDGKNLELIAVTDGYCDTEGIKFINGYGEPATQYQSTNIWFMKGYNIVMLMDNLVSYKSNDTYKKYTNTQKPLKINVDAPIIEEGESGAGIPAYTDTYYNLTSIAGSRYDYSRKLGKEYIYNKKYDSETEQSTVSIPTVTGISGGKLNVSNLSNWSAFAIANLSDNKTGTAGAKYVFDTTFVWNGGSQTAGTGAAAYIGPLGSHKAVDNSYMPAYTAITFSETDPDVIYIGGAELERGKAYNVRIEYVVGESIHVYVDNVEAYGGFVAKGANADETTFEAFGFYMRKNFVDAFEFTLDNTFVGVVYPDGEGNTPIVPVDPNAPPIDAGLPDGLETVYANTEYKGTRYDFATPTDYTADEVYNKTAADGVIASDIAKVIDGKLYVDNMGLNWQGVAFKNGAETSGGNGYTYVFEADFRWISGHQAEAQLASGAGFIGFLGEHASVDNNYMSAWGYMKFIEGESNKMMIGNAVINRGTTYNLRFEYTVGTGVKMYVNGVLSDFGTVTSGKNSDLSTFQGFGIYLRKNFSPDFEFTVDNVYMGIVAPEVVTPDPETEIGYAEAVNVPGGVSATVSGSYADEAISVSLNAVNSDSSVYSDPLTLKVVIPDTWAAVKITVGIESLLAQPEKDGTVSYVQVSASSGDTVIITEAKAADEGFYTYYGDESVQGSRYDFNDNELPEAFIANNDKTTTPSTLSVSNGALNETTTSWHGFAVTTGNDKAYSAGKYVFEADFTMNTAVYKSNGAAFVGFITYANQSNGSITIQDSTTNAAAFADVYMTVSNDAQSYGWFGESLVVGKSYNLRVVYDVETDICTVYVDGEEVASAEYGTSNSVKNRDDSVYRGFIFYPRVSGMEFTVDNVFVGVVDGVETVNSAE